MGYDDGECIMCFFWGSVNDTTDHRAYLCGACADDCIKRYGTTQRLTHVLAAKMTTDKPQMCFKCKEEKCLVFHVSVHKSHTLSGVKDDDD